MFRNEYPRPELVRDNWDNLNGSWDFQLNGDWGKIEVPFVYQSELSGIGQVIPCDHVAYRRTFQVNSDWKGKQVLLHFGAVDYECEVYVNGSLVGCHTGGYARFSFDITERLNWACEEVLVRVYDPCTDETIPRGKQHWDEKPSGIWYTRSTGIWQTVWLEAVPEYYITDIKLTSDVDGGFVDAEITFSEPAASKGTVCEGKASHGAEVGVLITFRGKTIFEGRIMLTTNLVRTRIDISSQKIFRSASHSEGWCWTPEKPNLFDAEWTLYKDGEAIDKVSNYFGMRKIETKNGKVYLNNHPYYQKLILDQGYWPQTLLTARDDDDFVNDILMAKAMGFNGCRKHQKAEDPRFLYHADRLGFLVWGEIGSCASFSMQSTQRVLQEWGEIINRDYNHPCIVAWVPLNESWGVPNIAFDTKQQAHSLALYYHLKSMDSTRLVIGNDGWEMTQSDICAIHNYAHGEADESDQQQLFAESLATRSALIASMPAGRPIYADGFTYQGVPIMLTEFGGLAFAKDNDKGWGYTTIASEEEFLETYTRLINGIRQSDSLNGYCYTQLTDVEQEMNGLLTYDRQYKLPPEQIKQINDMVKG